MNSYLKYQELVREYNDCCPDYGTSASLFDQILANNNMELPAQLAERLKLLENIREDIQGDFDKLRITYGGFLAFDAIEDWEKECKVVEDMISNRKLVRDNIQKKIEILKAWILLTKKVIMGEKKEKIETLVNELHNPKLIEEAHVTRIWNDGEIDSQKGGEIYGMRSVFTRSVSLNVEGLSFPIKGNNFSYAIVSSQNAEKIREMMK